ncbi:FAD-dependent oxidoreductase (plasmid) [Mycolicibacterium psychrotolerans]|uniref:FAD-dependent oxidoreductase n=1 Tax=Mycolicibacterium psychrotolerans TaxID=216929 RepID=UPI003D668952
MNRRHVAIVGAGPGGLATALAAHRAGFRVSLYERYTEIKPSGNILNLWPPPQKILGLLGVDITDLGAPADVRLARSDGHVRATVDLPQHIKNEYRGGFIGLLRWGLYNRMLEALPDGVLKMGHNLTAFEDRGEEVVLHFDGHPSTEADVLVGADGINSAVRRALWDSKPIRHQRLHLVGGYLLFDNEPTHETVIANNKTVQGSYSAIRHDGRWGYEWWVLEAYQPGDPPPENLHDYARMLARDFAGPLRDVIEETPAKNLQRWEIRDRKPLKRWSKGRVTLVGDSAHPTSPYVAYGAGMSIEDAYFLACELEKVDLGKTYDVECALDAYESRRRPFTAHVTETAYWMGQVMHHVPAVLRPVRDRLFDHTPLMQKCFVDREVPKFVGLLDDIDHAEHLRASAATVPPL